MATTTTTTVSATVSSSLQLNRTSNTAPSQAKDSISVTAGTTTSLGGSTTPAITKAWTRTLDLSASTPVTLDLTTLTGGQGDTDLTGHVFGLAVQNHTTTAGYDLTIGNAAATAFDFGAGATGTIAIGPGQPFVMGKTAGWVVDSTHKSLKLDPGTNAVTATVTLVSGT